MMRTIVFNCASFESLFLVAKILIANQIENVFFSRKSFFKFAIKSKLNFLFFSGVIIVILLKLA